MTDVLAPVSEAAPLPACSLCQNPVAPGSGQLVNDHLSCDACVQKLQAELKAQASSPSDLPAAIGCGLVGACIAAAIWAVIAVVTDYELGFIAVLVGYLAGLGVKLGAGSARGSNLQWAASLTALVGLLLAKYLLFAHFFRQAMVQENVEAPGWFDGFVFQMFANNFVSMLSPYDALWVYLAIDAARRVPAAAKVKFSPRPA